MLDHAVQSIGVVVRAPDPTNRDGVLERFEEILEINSLRLTDPHEARARELELLGDSRRAARVRNCSVTNGSFPKWTCKQPCCPTCAEVRAAKHGRKVREAIAKMKNPVLGLYTWFVLPEMRRPLLVSADDPVALARHRKPNGLREGISAFRDAHKKLRGRKCFAGIRGGVGALETKISDSGRGFNLHVHEVLDAAHIDEVLVNAAWVKLTDKDGTFMLKEIEETDEDGHPALSKYVTKANTWCPPAGEVGLRFLAEIQRAIHGRRLLVAWGTGDLRQRRART